MAVKLRAAALKPGDHVEAVASIMTEALDLWNLRRLLSTAEQHGHRSARFALARAAGRLRGPLLGGWTTELLEGHEPLDAAANNAAARDANDQDLPNPALLHALTAMAQRIDEYSGKTTARTCRLLRHPAFLPRDNSCWKDIGCALEGKTLEALDPQARRKAQAAAEEVFASFGLDYRKERAMLLADSRLLVRPRSLPDAIAEGPASMVVDPWSGEYG